MSHINNNVRKVLEDLKKRITEIPDIEENIQKENIVYSIDNKEFCVIKIRKDYLEIDFKADNSIVDPIGISWKIGKNQKFERRMQLKNGYNIEMAYDLIFQAYCIQRLL